MSDKPNKNSLVNVNSKIKNTNPSSWISVLENYSKVLKKNKNKSTSKNKLNHYEKTSFHSKQYI